MHNKIGKILFLFVLAFVMVGCTGEGCNNKEKIIDLSVLQPTITIDSDNALNHDYTKYFIITVNDEIVPTLDTYLDLTNVSDKAGSYVVSCTYESKISTLIVNVIKKQTITITKSIDTIELDSLTVLDHDFKQYFTIVDGDEKVEVKDEYLDLNNISANEGTYDVICRYKQEQATIKVNISLVTYQIKLSTNEITLKQSEVNTYDYKSLFTVVVNGKIKPITDDMITNAVISEIGSYNFTVKLGESQMTLKVNVISDHEVEIINSYNLKEIEEDDLETFDFTSLFTVYVDNEYRLLQESMIDKSALDTVSPDSIYTIKVTYTEGNATKTSECQIKVVPNVQAQITAKNIDTYPNGDYIDLTQLFEVKLNGEVINVTSDMITGSIDYTKEGQNEIVLSYLGQTETAIVTVHRGVIINYRNSDVIEIIKDTDISKYDFSKDFIVLINGIEFTKINDYIKKDNVDFSTVGLYETTIEIPYTKDDQETVYSKTIKYNVVDVSYELNVINPLVVLESDTTEYNVFDNISLKVNGINQRVSLSKTEGAISKHGEILNDIDFNSIAVQEINLAVYVFGMDKDPVNISYQLMKKSNIEIEAKTIVCFSNQTIYTKDLFKIVSNGEEIAITQDMIEGKVDTSKPGKYDITINYLGMSKVASVIILNDEMIGVYKTQLKTIKQESTEDDEGYTTTAPKQTVLKNLYITREGQISVNGSIAEIISAISENILLIKISANFYNLYYNNGIVFLDPNNDIKLSFNDAKRPMIYFNEEMWDIENHIVINSTTSYVLNNTITAYSFDIFDIKSKITEEKQWYGLKVHLYERTGSDTQYMVSCGVVSFEEDYKFEVNEKSSFTYLDETYRFSLATKSEGSISKEQASQYKYENMSFTGVVNGSSAILTIGQYESASIRIGTKELFNVAGNDIKSQKYGGYDYENNTLYISQMRSSDKAPVSYFITLDLENLTFEVVQKDLYFGKFTSSKMEVFLDGYGKGVINFDINQYGTTCFDYQLQNNELVIKYIDITPSFKFGNYATFYMDALYNTLTLKYLDVEEFSKDIFINRFITDGAIVSISNYELPTYSNNVYGRKALLDLIKIITVDGEIAIKVKNTMVDVTKVDFTKKGFYQFTITAKVAGNDVVMYYAVQIG